jgi:hypothetical protein
MFTLVASHNINVHHKEANLIIFYNHKIWNEDIFSLGKLDQGIDGLQQW